MLYSETEYNITNTHNVLFFSAEVRESVCESLSPAHADRERNQKSRDAGEIYS